MPIILMSVHPYQPEPASHWRFVLKPFAPRNLLLQVQRTLRDTSQARRVARL